jgi:type III restriction enzyme
MNNNEKLSKTEEEYKEWFNEYEESISQLKDETLKRELAEMELEEAKEIIERYKSNLEILSKTIIPQKTECQTQQTNISVPFNICVLGEVADEALIRKELNQYFQKIGISTTYWYIEFLNNTKLQNSDILRSLVKGQSKFKVIITGQIFSHSGKSNKSANLITELKNDKYIPHIVGCSPKEKLTNDKIISELNNFISK